MMNVPSGLVLLVSGAGHRYCQKRIVLVIRGGSTAVVVVNPYIPTLFEKKFRGAVEVEVLFASEAWTVTDTQHVKLCTYRKQGVEVHGSCNIYRYGK